MEELVALLKEKQLTISSCESLTAGLFSASIASVPGASCVLMGGLVTYQNDIKKRVAHVDGNIINTFGVISRECVIEMATHTKELFQSDICVSFSGNAGPGRMEDKPAGLVYCAIAYENTVETYECRIQKQRNEVRQEVVNFMCEKVKCLVKTKL